MSFEKSCFHNFTAKDINRGREYFFAGNVEILGSDATHCDALVRGSSPEPYEVTLDWSDWEDDRLLLARCDCPRFADVGQCKHIVAALLAADAEGLSQQIPAKFRLNLVTMDEEGYAEEPPLDDDDESVEPWDPDSTKFLSNLPVTLQTLMSRELKPAGRKSQKPNSFWRQALDAVIVTQAQRQESIVTPRRASKPREILFLIHIDECRSRGELVVHFYQRQQKKNGEYGKLKPLQLSAADVEQAAEPGDQQLLALLAAHGELRDSGYYYSYAEPTFERSVISPIFYELILPALCATGRFGWIKSHTALPEESRPLAWDAGPPWQFELSLDRDEAQQAWRLGGRLRRGDESVDLAEPVLLMASGLVIFRDHLARLNAGNSFTWIPALRNTGPLSVPFKDQDDLAERLCQAQDLPLPNLPAELRWEQVRVTPIPQISIRPVKGHRAGELLQADVVFGYDGRSVAANDHSAAIIDRDQRLAIHRDLAQEKTRLRELSDLGLRPAGYYASRGSLELPARRLPEIVPKLIEQGWLVEAEGAKFRTAGEMRVSVSGGVDWFDLDVQCDFGGVTVGLPKLLEALRRGEKIVRLDDGSQGILPEDWLARYAPAAGLGKVHDGKLRFVASQAGFLDALLAAQPKVDVDAVFEKARQRLRSFSGVTPCDQPAGFQGQLRDYQREGLGWLNFLREFQLGGCLADDMGLGKTIQVLALLESRRSRRLQKDDQRRPSLAVVPRSLIHNWIEEAARFTPKLKVLDYTGLGRTQRLEEVGDYDLLLTTYGTLRRDVKRLGEIRFDYAILDESQAIKNAGSQSAKAVRLLAADHRLAMTGTPVENHLGELWSLFEFLNPGMLGRLDAFKEFSKNGRASNAESVELLARALRPYILRRTKEQVLKELPEKTEQTLYCELEAPQRKLYNELRDHYRQALDSRIEREGLQKAKIHVLEALLRLRQAACHPGLLDKAKQAEGSAKLDALLEQLREVLDAGHKALVFSQFTSLLAIVREHLDRDKIVYEYLDGKTRNRGEKVKRFQEDPDCKLFLISLKAGGLGLNLTAADYVFILDPWWNPAVEAQAVDRAHRIGQTRRVFAYRLIAQDTVEEKILQLQQNKRNLAEAIISADNSLLTSLTAEDLRLLLS